MPEKSLSEIPRNLRELFEKGTTALQRQNLDYAIALFDQVLQKEPGFYDCREALRASQFKKAGSGTSFFKRVLGTASNSPLLAKGQLLLRNNPLEAINLAEQILNSDPNNAQAHKLLAEAALEADFPRTAVLSLEIAFKNSPKDKETALRLGQALAKTGQVARAESIYTELQRSYPNDSSIGQALKNVSAKRTLSEGGYEALADGTGSYRDILRDKAEAVSLEQEKREVKSGDVAQKLIDEYEARLIKEPHNSKLARSIAELCAQKNDFDRALSYYHQISAAEGSDPSLERAIIETTLKKFDHSLGQLDPDDSEYATKSAQLKGERLAFHLGEVQRQMDKYPNDLQLRFELGQLYLEAGKISQAIQEFQRAQVNPHRRIAALNYLGQCFALRGMNDLAARTFQNALKEKLVFDDEKKELIYFLGSVLEKMGKKEEAIEQFKQIYEVDIGYRDVAAKIDAYYGGN
jgi:tetratricopeptide (TPR) repeat protein